MNQSQMEPRTEGELRFWLNITRRLPKLRGAGRVTRMAERIYNRRKRADAAVDVLGFKMLLDPSDSMEGQLLFSPQLHDCDEIACLRENLKPGQTFVDAGANVGFYTLTASSLVGNSGKVIAIEADPGNASRLATNLKLSGIKNVQLMNVGLSDKAETLRLGLNTTGNRSGHSFLGDAAEGVTVECKTLTDVLLGQGINRVDGAKMDIEGFEFRVLERFFSDGNENLWPKFLIIEDNQFLKSRTGDTLGLLKRNGYSLTPVGELNYLAVRK